MDKIRLGNIATNSSSNDMMDKAKRVWDMLDELASSDPTAYKSYIQKTLKEGKEWMTPPTPCFAVRSVLYNKPNFEIFYLNVFTWNRLPAPNKTDEAIKMYPITPTETSFDNESCVIFNVAVHPNTMETAPQEHLIQSILNLVISEYKLHVDHEQYCFLQEKTAGNLKEIQRQFLKPVSKTDQNDDNNVEAFADKDLSPSLIKQLSSITLTNQPSSSNQQESHQPKKSVKPPVLIEELWTTPVFTEEISTNNKSLIIRVSLPDCESVVDCDVLFLPEEETIQVECSKLHMRLKLDMKKRKKPDVADSTSIFAIKSSSAKFVRKTQQLVLTIPIIVESRTNVENT
ncbi:unnamed protein product [Adineta ricciae]|uniref:PIH1 N-terminal domain-containing protein n=1 Tax=Adineta ricciae TaxID=249248 RepID=A0A813WRH8_ADIRI|nr:unnamed protein product [Adineta ricciae]CAF1185171.1 unnamed protein product [Adineta ricciae]